MIKWIFFDLDGVLLDSRDWHFESLKEALKKHDINLGYEEHLKYYDGLPTLTKLEMMSSRFNLCSQAIQDIYKNKQEIFGHFLESNLKPSDPIIDLLQNLKFRGIHMAVCSNAIRKTVESCLMQLEITHFFDFYLSNQDVKMPKPSPEIYFSALEKANIISEEAIIVEDSPHGIEAAKKTGCGLIRVKNSKELTYENFLNLTREFNFE